MRPCEQRFCGGSIANDAGRLVCLLCAFVAFEPEVSIAEKMASNATHEEPDHSHGRRAQIDVSAVTARVLAAVQAERESR